MPKSRGALAIAMALGLTVAAEGQARIDVVTLANGDRITGEVKRLERGQLEFTTDDAGTLYLEWDKLISVVATTRYVEVLTTDGRRLFGSLGQAAPREVAVTTPEGTTPVLMSEVTLITPIGTSLWRKLDGSIDLGFSYTKSSGIAQLNLNWDTVYRKPASSLRFSASVTETKQDPKAGDDVSDEDDRGSIEASYLWYPWQHWFVTGGARFEANKSLGLKLRSQLGGAVGPRLLNTNRAQMTLGAGLVVNDEQGVDVERTQNAEGLVTFNTSYYTYDRPRTNVDLSVSYYPNLSDWGRRRLQLDAALRREVFKDFFVSLSAFDSFDSRPPNEEADKNDFGIVFSVGWSY
jgi:hypothetical protein